MTLPMVSESTPFGPEVLVYKVLDKLFALIGEEEGMARMNLKGDPLRNEVLREQYEAIIPGYHMNKKHWNTLVFDDTVPRELVEAMILESYELVVAGMTKKERAKLGRG